MRLLALDAGFTTGYAVVEPGKPPITGSRDIPGSANQLGLACHYFGHLVRDLIAEHRPTHLVLCTPYISKKFQDINPTKVLFGLYGMAKAVAYAANIIVDDLHEPTVRAAFNVKVPKGTPKNKRHAALKNAVEQACHVRRWAVPNHHAGDAMLAAAFRLGELLLLTEQGHQTVLQLPTPKRWKQRKKKAA